MRVIVVPALWASLFVASGVLSLGGTGLAAPGASRVIDRTFACSPQAYGGVGDLNLVVTPSRTFASDMTTHLIVRSGSWSPTENLLFVRTRPNSRGTGWYGAANGAPGAFAHSQRCVAARARVALSAKGLAGPPVRWHKEIDCQVRGRVLVHVRSLLERPAEWRRFDSSYVGARANIVQSKLAVRLERTGKPIAYMEHDAKGNTKVWYSSACS